MPSYFRNWFGKDTNHSSSKSERTKTPAPVYTSAPARPSTARSYSHSTATPSPLGNSASIDTRTTYGYGRRGSTGAHTSDLRPQVLMRASSRAPHPIYTPSAGQFTPASSRSNSNSSVFTMSSAPYGGSRSDSGHHYQHATPHSDRRPPLSTNNSWHSSSYTRVGSASSSVGSAYARSESHAYAHGRPSSLNMHPILAYTRLHRAPITYDVTFTPSARTVLDRATRSAIPPHTLAQPATDPPTPSSSRLILRSHKFPWPVIVQGSGPRFTIGPPKGGRGSSANAITNLDVLYAVHTTLLTPITPEEWESLGHGSRAQQKVTKAYERRCSRMGGGWEAGVRRIDWLGEKTRLVGVEIDKSTGNGVGKLVFAKA